MYFMAFFEIKFRALTAIAFIALWRHQMETFSALLAICAGHSPVTGEFPSQKPVTRSFDVFFDFICATKFSSIFLLHGKY